MGLCLPSAHGCYSPLQVCPRTVIVRAGTSADSNSPWQVRPRTSFPTPIIVLGHTFIRYLLLYLPAKVIGLGQDR
jgi:hypothetical protein